MATAAAILDFKKCQYLQNELSYLCEIVTVYTWAHPKFNSFVKNAKF